uniref:Uncharacterized protein n=1 Tax=viral metagenome TaxID=1070528 RepID=A0A6C0CK50_9ZZZZ
MKGKLIHKIYYYYTPHYLNNNDEKFKRLGTTIYRFQLENTEFSLRNDVHLNKVSIEHLCHFSKYMGADALLDFGLCLMLCKSV